MRLLIDENVPDSVSEFFRQRGHEVVLVRDLLPNGTPDAVISVVGDNEEAIIVTWDKDFKLLAARVQVAQRRLRKLGRISFRCRESRGLARAKECIELLEIAYDAAQRRKDKRLIVEISETTIRFVQ